MCLVNLAMARSHLSEVLDINKIQERDVTRKPCLP
jgi:hypothetical protein